MYCKSCGLEVKIGDSKCRNCGGKEFTDEKPFVESRLYKKAVMLMETRGGSNKTIILTKFLAWYSLFISFVIGTVFGSNDDFHYFALVYIILFLGSIATIRYSHLKRVSLIYQLIIF